MGSHLTDKLMMDGHELTVVDNFFTGRKRNVEHWIGHENFELINHDVVEPLYIEGEKTRACHDVFDLTLPFAQYFPLSVDHEYKYSSFTNFLETAEKCLISERQQLNLLARCTIH